MDQFVILAAREAHALSLQTGISAMSICRWLADTLPRPHHRRELDGETFHGAGDYGVRRREVEAGQAILKEHFPQSCHLGHATLDDWKHAACRCPRRAIAAATMSFLKTIVFGTQEHDPADDRNGSAT